MAAALLKDPELLILDEPTNGLDPAGMAEMRALIRRLGQGNRTVLLSSHLMNEVEQICDRVGVIHDGRLVAEGRLDELRGEGRLLVRAHPIGEAQRLLSTMKEISSIHAVDGTLHIVVDPSGAARINRELVNAGIAVSELYAERASLESIFLKLTHNGGAENVE